MNSDFILEFTQSKRESDFLNLVCLYACMCIFFKINFPEIHIVKSFKTVKSFKSQISSTVREFQELLPEYALLSTACKDHVARLDYLNSTGGYDMKEKSSTSVYFFLSMF